MSIDLDPYSLPSRTAKISNLYTDSLYKEGIEEINKALFFFPDDSDLYNQKANMHRFLLQNKLAIDAYSKAIEIDPENGFMYMQKADFLATELNRQEEALVLYKMANKLKPDEPSRRRF